jgi:hypothetical protein
VFQSYGYLLSHISLLMGLATIRARTLRATVFLGSFTHNTGRCAPPSAIAGLLSPGEIKDMCIEKSCGEPQFGEKSAHQYKSLVKNKQKESITLLLC